MHADDFSDGTVQNLTARDAGYTDIGIALKVFAAGYAGITSSGIHATGYTGEDGRCKITWGVAGALEASTSIGPGIHGANSGGLQGYTLYMTTGATYILKWTAGTWSSLDTGSAQGGATGNAELVREGNDVVGYIDGVEVARATDTTYTTGVAFLYVEGGSNTAGMDTVEFGSAAAGIDVPALTLTPSFPSASLASVVVLTFGDFAVTLLSDKPIATGTHLNGYPFAEWDATATVRQIISYTTGNGPATTSAPYLNGAMLNPEPGALQGYHDAEAAFGDSYQHALNVGVGIANGTPLDLDPATAGRRYDSFCPAESIGVHGPAVGPERIWAWCPFTIYAPGEAPAGPSTKFVPWSSGPIKQPADVDTSQIVTTSLLGADLSTLNAYWTQANAATMESKLDRIWCDHVGGWVGRYLHPTADMPALDYGQYIAMWMSRALVMLHDVDCNSTLPQKIVQQALDSYGIRVNGGGWPPNGGHGQGRKPLWIAAYKLLGEDSTVIDPAALIDDDNFTNEDGQSFIVEETSAGVYNQGYGRDVSEDPTTAFTAADVGTASWGFCHTEDVTQDADTYWTGAYYLNLNLPYWQGAAWAIQQMYGRAGSYSVWNHDAYWKVLERVATLIPSKNGPETTALWEDATIGYDYGTPGELIVPVLTLTPTFPLFDVTLAGGLAVPLLTLTATYPLFNLAVGSISAPHGLLLLFLFLFTDGSRMRTFRRWVAITKHDTDDFASGHADGIYVGGGGNVAAVHADGTVVTITAPAGGYLLGSFKRVNSTDTTATLMFALYL